MGSARARGKIVHGDFRHDNKCERSLLLGKPVSNDVYDMNHEYDLPLNKMPGHLRGYESFFSRQFQLMKGLTDFSPRVLDRHILVAGVGGNGCHVALALVRMGFREITLIDKDVVEPSNLTRQVLYKKEDIGRRKVEVALESLEENNLCSSISTHHGDILEDRKRFGELVKKSDFVFNMVDSIPARILAADTCIRLRRPMISGGTDASKGILTDIQIQEPEGRPCLFCNLLPFRPPREFIEFCHYREDQPVLLKEKTKRVLDKITGLGHRPGASFYLIANLGSTLMVAAMLKYLMGHTFPNRYVFNIYTLSLFTYEMKPRKDCELCGAVT